MKKQPFYPAEQMLEATLKGFGEVKKAIDSVQQAQKIQAKATYSGLTGSGKARYVTELANAYGSQAMVARMLDLTDGRISQLVNSEKNRKNGK
jgi:excinuclease UvrABC helicase subunit UvrB